MVKFLKGCALLRGDLICNSAASKGTIMDYDEDDPTIMKLAEVTSGAGLGGEFLGILTVAVVANNDANKNDRYIKGQTGIFEETALAGERATLRGGAGEIETDIVATGSDTGAIDATTPQDTELSVASGKWRVAQTDDKVKGRLMGAGTELLQYLIEIF